MEVTDKIWTRNVNILYQKDRISEIIPVQDMTLAEKLNSLMRLSIIIGIILSVLLSDYKYLYIPIIMGFMQIGAVQMEPKLLKDSTENFDIDNTDFNHNEDVKEQIKPEKNSNRIVSDKVCTKPTKDNPFMNAMNYDSRYKQSACVSHDNEELQDNIDKFFNNNLFKDISDIYDKRASQRQFFTMPYTTFPNDSGNFAKWLYGQPPTCKEGNGAQCVANNYDRLQGSSYKLV
jgi:hypothetical protein